MKQYKNSLKRKRGVVLTVAGLKRFQAAILDVERTERGGKRFTQAELSDRIGVSTATLSRLWSLNSRIDPRTLRICFSAFDLRLDERDYTLFDADYINGMDESWEENEEDIGGDTFDNTGNIDLFSANNVISQIVSIAVGEEKSSHVITFKERVQETPTIIPDTTLELLPNHHYEYNLKHYCKYPSGPIAVDSQLYIPRRPLQEIAYQEITQPGCVIRIQGCREMGKTSLMLRILAHAMKLGYKTVTLNLNQVDIDILQKPRLFMQWLTATISRKLGVESHPEQYWDEEIGNKLSCTLYMKECLLAPLEQPFLLVLDDVHHIFEYPNLAREFLPLLRSWQEEAQHEQVWQKLRMLIVYSTEIYIPLDINQSPFNIGLPLKLSDFNHEQVIELAKKYGIDWRVNNEAKQLMQLVGGHPALINLALYYIRCQQLTLEEICTTASTHTGIYRQHLQSLLNKLQKNSQLLEIFHRILRQEHNIPLDPLNAYKLENMGLIRLRQQNWVISCKLYRDFFDKYLVL
ncbi:AAA-like domain-containing protein [Calothrix sp. 336/3]|uniref:AAA-like domain-containing protein n=1 Tax=Calothrix sp. 336/3 TaxID=1337936 RepID=UPI0004E323B7|nr:AAA-like domain-containing protein [Calothrix sp. 336/3]AKG21358.1 hypothetical protein IJ00_08680 [Calothrix sp. 336/3]